MTAGWELNSIKKSRLRFKRIKWNEKITNHVRHPFNARQSSLCIFFKTFRKTGRVKLQGFTDLLLALPSKTDRFTLKETYHTSICLIHFFSSLKKILKFPTISTQNFKLKVPYFVWGDDIMKTTQTRYYFSIEKDFFVKILPKFF